MQTLGDIFRNAWVRFVALIFFAIALILFIYYMRDILIPFTLALLGAYILCPIVDRLERWHISRGLGVMLVSLLVIAAIGLLGFLIYLDVSSSFAQEKNAPKQAQSEKGEVLTPLWFSNMIEKQVNRLPERFVPAARKFVDFVYSQILPKLAGLLESVDKAVSSLLKSSAAIIFGIFNFLIFLVVVIYLLIDFHVFLDACYSYVPANLKADALRVARVLDADLMAFFRGQLTVAGSVTVLYLAGLLIAGIPFALPVAVIAGIGNMIPYMGTLVGISLGLIASIVGYGLDIHLLYVVLVFIIAQAIDGLFITPTLIGKNVGFNPVIVILSLLVFGKLLGFFGVLLAIPLTSVTRIILLEIYNRVELKGKVEKTATDVIMPPGPEEKKSE